ncbi:variable large family protein [Borrelia recurrentis]|uniref:variable large family protein n=1 Tax=Borrelia recurrentis TaxID=44449 RepID=UPI000320CA76|nr:variable large family protein [Borrelia recurrentis]
MFLIEESVKAIIEGIKEIVELAENSGVNVSTGDAGDAVAASSQTAAPAALNGGHAGSQQGAGVKLAEEVSKADPWVMIDKIRKSNVSTESGYMSGNKKAGELITGKTSSGIGVGAETNADFAAAVALKAMSKDGKFAVYAKNFSSNDANKIKEAATEAVNKVLDTLGLIIRRTVRMEIGKVNKKVIDQKS